MASLITTTQLGYRLQQTGLDPNSLQLACDNSSGLIRAIAKQQIDFVSQETVVLTGGERTLTLPERPLVIDAGPNLLTVVELGEFGGISLTLVENRDYSRVGSQLTRGYPWWWNSTTTRLMGWPRYRPLGVFAPRVQVTYSHGYTTIPDDVISLTLDAAAVLMANPAGLRQMSIDDYSEQYAIESLGSAMVDAIRVKLGITGRRRRAFSIRLG